MSLDKFKSDLHIDMAAKGCVSGTLSEWPMLRKSLRENGLHLDNNTDAITLRKICSLIANKCKPDVPIQDLKALAMDHPVQPLEVDKDGITRFKMNAIVRHLLDNGGIDMNQIGMLDFEQNDREQFAQLIGYSLSGFADLSYVSDKTYELAAVQTEF